MILYALYGHWNSRRPLPLLTCFMQRQTMHSNITICDVYTGYLCRTGRVIFEARIASSGTADSMGGSPSDQSNWTGLCDQPSPVADPRDAGRSGLRVCRAHLDSDGLPIEVPMYSRRLRERSPFLPDEFGGVLILFVGRAYECANLPGLRQILSQEIKTSHRCSECGPDVSSPPNSQARP